MRVAGNLVSILFILSKKLGDPGAPGVLAVKK